MRVRGYSLLELLIAIAIGLFLVAGLLTITNAMKHTTGIQNNLTLLQDNQRIAINLMSDVIQEAGYYPSPIGTKTARSEFGAIGANAAITVSGLAMSAGQTILGAGGVNGSDAVTVRYETSGSDNVVDCAGQAYPGAAATGIVNTFQLDGAGNLACYTTTYAPPAPTLKEPTYEHLLVSNGGQTTGGGRSGIQYLDIQYGVQSNPNSGNTSIDAYLKAADVSANNLWNSVYSVRITYRMLSTSDLKVGGDPRVTQLCPTVADTDAGLQSLPPKCSITQTIAIMNKAGIH